jgi:glycosyltransferase involved in cell wall biosynthesis
MHSDLPLVTALINTYNYARYLPFAINSVLNQSYPNIEIIVVDDGSTDHTREILAEYADQVRTIRSENGGQGQTFNLGIPKARGQLLMLLDADDEWLPEKVERMVEFSELRPKAVMLYHRFQNVDDAGNELGYPEPSTLINGNYRARYIKSGGSWWSPVTSVLVLRLGHIRQALPVPTYAHREGADTYLTDYCALTGEIAALPEVLTLRRLHGANHYAAGREGYTYRSREIREGDVRRVEWRFFSLQQATSRVGDQAEIDIERNEWRTINLFWLGRASFWRLLRACLLCPEHSLRSRWERLKWAMRVRRIYGVKDQAQQRPQSAG